jgi:hypothetical protein
MSTAQPHALERARLNHPATQPRALRIQYDGSLAVLRCGPLEILSRYSVTQPSCTRAASARLTVLRHADQPGHDTAR